MAAGRIAKISIQADLAAFRVTMKEAESLIKNVGKQETMGLTPEVEARRSNFIKAMTAQTDVLKKKIVEIQDAMGELAKADVFDPEKMSEYVRNLVIAKNHFKDINSIMGAGGGGRGVGGAGGGGPGGGGGSGGGGGRGRGANFMQYLYGPRGAVRGLMPLRLLGMAGVMALGVAGFRQQLGIARETRQFRALTGITGDEPIEGYSEYGFGAQERRTRGLQIAMGTGRRMDYQESERRIRQSEMYERALGVTGETQANLLGAGRRAGFGRDLTPRLIGQAVAVGMTGSRMIEYLESMTESLSSLSQGVNIDSESISALSGTLIGASSFFRQDPRRVGRTLQSLNEMFQSGDRFQQAQAARAIMRAGGAGTTVAGAEVRRAMGLFANLRGTTRGDISEEPGGEPGKGEDLIEYFRNINPQFAKTLGISGADIINNIFNEIKKSTTGISTGQRAYEFMSRIGMMNQGGLELFRAAEETGGKISEEQVQGVFKKQKEEEDRLLNVTIEIKNILNKQLGALSTKTEFVGAKVQALVEDTTRETIASLVVKTNEHLGKYESYMDKFYKGYEDKSYSDIALEVGKKFITEPVEMANVIADKIVAPIAEGFAIQVLKNVPTFGIESLNKSIGDLIVAIEGNTTSNDTKKIRNPEQGGGMHLNIPKSPGRAIPWAGGGAE